MAEQSAGSSTAFSQWGRAAYGRFTASKPSKSGSGRPGMLSELASSTTARALLGFVSGCAGGALFRELGFPLPWTLGSLTAAAVIAMAGLDWKLPSAARNAARPIIGVMAGSAFTAEVARSMVHWWEAILPLVAFLVLITLAGRAFFTRFCGFDKTTAFFASTPGGLSELTLLGAQYGGNIRQLVLIHSTRIITVVFLVPFAVRLLFDLEGGRKDGARSRVGGAFRARLAGPVGLRRALATSSDVHSSWSAVSWSCR